MSKVFSIYLPVWGKAFTKNFLDVTLPSWLAPGNFDQNPSCQLVLHTTKEDAWVIEQHPTWLYWNSHFRGEVRPIYGLDEVTRGEKYLLIGRSHADGLEESLREKTVCILLSPDLVMGDGGLGKVFSLIGSGKKVVAVAPLNRTCLEEMVPFLKEHFDPRTHSISVSNRKLIEQGIAHLHPDSAHLFWTYPKTAVHLSLLYWAAGKKSLIAKFFHIHPLAIDMSTLSGSVDFAAKLRHHTIDGILLESLGLAKDDFYVVTSSDELAIIEMTSKKTPLNYPSPSKSKLKTLLKFAAIQRPIHRATFAKYDFHYQANEEVNWEEASQRVNRALRPYRCLLPIKTILKRRK